MARGAITPHAKAIMISWAIQRVRVSVDPVSLNSTLWLKAALGAVHGRRPVRGFQRLIYESVSFSGDS